MVTDPVSDMLTVIRNGLMARKKDVTVPSSKLKKVILEILKKEGYIEDYQEFSVPTRKEEQGKKLRLQIFLKYYNEKPVIAHMEKVSKPGRRIYVSANEIPRVRNGLGIAILSTSKGILTDSEAKRENVGGELLCIIW